MMAKKSNWTNFVEHTKWIINTRLAMGATAGMGLVAAPTVSNIVVTPSHDHQEITTTIEELRVHTDAGMKALGQSIVALRNELKKSDLDGSAQTADLQTEVDKFNKIVGRLDWRFRKASEKMETWMICRQGQ